MHGRIKDIRDWYIFQNIVKLCSVLLFFLSDNFIRILNLLLLGRTHDRASVRSDCIVRNPHGILFHLFTVPQNNTTELMQGHVSSRKVNS